LATSDAAKFDFYPLRPFCRQKILCDDGKREKAVIRFYSWLRPLGKREREERASGKKETSLFAAAAADEEGNSHSHQ
jgi:hypothetical protein